MLTKVFPSFDQKAAGAAGRVADDVLGRRSDHFDHHADDVPRRSELPVPAGRGDLAQHVLVQVALGIAVVHGMSLIRSTTADKQARFGDHKDRVGHRPGKRTGLRLSWRFLMNGKTFVPKRLEHLLGFEVLEPGPAEIDLAVW